VEEGMSDMACQSPVLSQAALHQHPRLLPHPGIVGKVASVVPEEEVCDPSESVSAAALKEQAWQDAYATGLTAGREAGYADGHTEGVLAGEQAGRKSGMVKGEAMLQEMREALAAREQQFQALMQSIPAALARRFDSGEDDMLALVQAALCQLLGDAIAHRDGASLLIRQALTQAIVQTASRQQFIVRVHPDDVALLHHDESILSLGNAGIVWQADPQIMLGGCQIDTRDGTLDARLEVQLEEFSRLLLQVRAAGRVPVAEEGV
jgi:flagellar assembly protein FliH